MSAATVRIGAVELGPGRPKVCVPLTGATVEALEAEARAIRPAVADLVELRIDRFAAVADVLEVGRAIDAVRDALDPALPILFTFRTARGGRRCGPARAAYRDLLLAAVGHRGVAAVDVEMALPEEVVSAVVTGRPRRRACRSCCRSTTCRAPRRGRRSSAGSGSSRTLGADVVKLACTPADPGGRAGAARARPRTTPPAPVRRPAITMAMGPLGVVSRLAGETFGSALTFGTVGAASAPGQVDAARLRAALELIHEAQAR